MLFGILTIQNNEMFVWNRRPIIIITIMIYAAPALFTSKLSATSL